MKKITYKTAKMKLVEQVNGEALEELLRKLYVDENKSAVEIGQVLGLAQGTVWTWLQMAGIYSRKLRVF